MVFDRESLCKEICQVVFPWSPGNDELLSGQTVADPMVLHFDAFCSFWFDGVVRDALGTFVVGENICCRLRVAEIFQDLSETSTVLSGQEASDILGLAD